MRVEKTDKQWKEQLTPEQYRIARKGGTERAFTGKYWDTKKEGTYANRKTVLSKFCRSAVHRVRVVSWAIWCTLWGHGSVGLA